MKIRTVLALALTGSVSCSSGTGRVIAPHPAPAAKISFVLLASAAGGSAREPVTITAIIQNLGSKPVDIPNRCPEPLIRLYDSRGGELLPRDPKIRLYDPLGILGGGELLLRDPTVPVVCPAVASIPLPAGRYDSPLTFDGGYYTLDGRRLSAPAGTYRAVATFAYVDAGVTVLTREVVFNWR